MNYNIRTDYLPPKDNPSHSGVTLGDGAPRLLAKRRPHMECTHFAHGKVTGCRVHGTNLVRILWLVDIIALDFIQTHLKGCQFNLHRPGGTAPWSGGQGAKPPENFEKLSAQNLKTVKTPLSKPI